MNHTTSNELTKIAFNHIAEKYFQAFKNELTEKEFDRKILDQFSDLLCSGSFVCDAGCGPFGQIAGYLSKNGHFVTGIDIAEKCIEIASENYPFIEFLTMDMMKTDFIDEEFDGIVSYYSIIHTPKNQIDKFMKEFHRILKPDGKLLIVVKKVLLKA